RLRRQFARLRLNPGLLRAAHRAPRPDPPLVGGPLAHAGVDGGAGGRCDGIPKPTHTRRTAGTQHRVDYVRRPAGDVSAGRAVAARPRARRDRGDHRERPHHDAHRAGSAGTLAAGSRLAVVRAAGDGGDGAGGDAVLTGRTGGRADRRTERARNMTAPPVRPPDRPTAVFLGADAGGSHSTVVVGTRSDVLGRAGGAVALATAFGTGPGTLGNAGTGSIAYARDPAGAVHRAGGYGWQLGDEGGGYWLGRRALDVAARAQDGRGEGSTLLARLL